MILNQLLSRTQPHNLKNNDTLKMPMSYNSKLSVYRGYFNGTFIYGKGEPGDINCGTESILPGSIFNAQAILLSAVLVNYMERYIWEILNVLPLLVG